MVSLPSAAMGHLCAQSLPSFYQNIALQSEKNFLEVKTYLDDFIQKNASVYEGINWLNSYLAGIEQQFYINKSENITIDDVVQLLALLKTDKSETADSI